MRRLTIAAVLMLLAAWLAGCGTREQWLRASQGFLSGTQDGLRANPAYQPYPVTPYRPVCAPVCY